MNERKRKEKKSWIYVKQEKKQQVSAARMK